MIKVAIVEDDIIISEFIKEVLLNLNYEISFISIDGDDILNQNSIYLTDIIFMDINLGSISGIDVVKKLKVKYPNIKIIYISAYSDKDTVDLATNTLPDGYLVKPFDERDLEIALNLTLKRLRKNIEFENYNFDILEDRVFFDNVELELSHKERRVIKILFQNIDRVVSYEEIKSFVWEGSCPTDSALKDLIYRVRKKLNRATIKNISGVGYRLTNKSRRN